MLSTTKTININGTSSVEVDGSKMPVVYYNAQIQSDGKFNINKSVQNEELYKAYRNEINADRDEFESLVESYTDTK